MADFRKYGIKQEKGRDYENIAYVMALVYNICEKRINKFLEEYGLSLSQFNVLMLLKSMEGEAVNQLEIGRRLIVTQGSITRLVFKLGQEKLIEVKQNKKNRRENLVKISKKGEDLLEEIFPKYDEIVKGMIDMIPSENHSVMSKILSDWFFKLQESED
ncbi:MAG: HTH-type transcriptional regulator MhqR [Alphaproteobacteria bacterium ADurb.Bin438]|nr:MAG: HTH-type transcriptional regulator MhqR [Alphaproteobacteria bacterium ADurb.Bin438]